MSEKTHYEHVEETFQPLDDSKLARIINEFAPIVEPRNRNLNIALASPFVLMILGKVFSAGLRVSGHHEIANAVEESNYVFSSLASAVPIVAGIYIYNSTGLRGKQRDVYDATRNILSKRREAKELAEEDEHRAM